MTRDQNIEIIRAACIKAQPEIEWTTAHSDKFGQIAIRLADVLWAFKSHEQYDAILDSLLMEEDAPKPLWNLRMDDLTFQSDDCLAFLADLLK